ncbi:hypothetical protein [Microvirga thermotolerans]|uniref:Lipoprotein n=1 Tax=Microvirga thermotolerans TaxID=2651334 RepID=A0A5P9JX59_9HYPH|nr:hypothetical protein [Microvirga thermotolerans]QFU16226.1 hypothetical protein GDR74_08315 [Microvirga thermotolerans]
MRIPASLPALLLLSGILAACNTSAPQGVLPRTPVPPPPSIAGSAQKAMPASRQASAAPRRRSIDVPSRLDAPPPASPTVEPVMTGRGVGAGFRF